MMDLSEYIELIRRKEESLRSKGLEVPPHPDFFDDPEMFKNYRHDDMEKKAREYGSKLVDIGLKANTKKTKPMEPIEWDSIGTSSSSESKDVPPSEDVPESDVPPPEGATTKDADDSKTKDTPETEDMELLELEKEPEYTPLQAFQPEPEKAPSGRFINVAAPLIGGTLSRLADLGGSQKSEHPYIRDAVNSLAGRTNWRQDKLEGEARYRNLRRELAEIQHREKYERQLDEIKKRNTRREIQNSRIKETVGKTGGGKGGLKGTYDIMRVRPAIDLMTAVFEKLRATDMDSKDVVQAFRYFAEQINSAGRAPIVQANIPSYMKEKEDEE